ncbi:hypothetical protein KKF59_02480 [Patescibacteria group bacterium]|nr:hypothetical protein [Patescibacteria group bacterium]MBU1034182.1 hypothetical protein [Patescibacteria group bacterium]MBU1629589.1 hypothetical protein [Patescibacteria group bacterium]MBU1907976.1 hypothetical protein [Patescibacteria group bacterium]
MNYTKLFGYGVAIWAAAYLTATIFVAYKSMETLIAQIVVAVVGALAAYIAGRKLAAKNAGAILKYSIPWVLIAVVLDMVLTVPFTGWGFFSTWSLWIGYALIALVPLAAIKK